jgi:methylamine dehydrogenase accessory protein MauD
MTGWLLVSYVVLWTLVAGCMIVLLVVLRQLGLIYLRIRGGAMHFEDGPAVGSAITAFEDIDDRTGEILRVPDPDHARTLLLFASPFCEICKDALRGLRHVGATGEAGIVVISDGSVEENSGLHQVVDGSAGFISSVRRQRQLSIETIPYALLLDQTGMVIDKHVVNAIDDVEELLERNFHDRTQLDAVAVH